MDKNIILESLIGYYAYYEEQKIALTTTTGNFLKTDALLVLDSKSKLQNLLIEKDLEKFEIYPCIVKSVLNSLDLGGYYAMDKNTFIRFQSLVYDYQDKDFSQKEKEFQKIEENMVIIFGNYIDKASLN